MGKMVQQLTCSVKDAKSNNQRNQSDCGIDCSWICGHKRSWLLSCDLAVVKQTGVTSQGFLISKTRLAKQDLTIPCLELVSCHMLSNLLHYTFEVLSYMHIAGVFAWSDSTACLQWIQGQGRYFVANRVEKIKEKEEIIWNYVPTEENPADIGCQGASNLDNIVFL